ncbi:MAG: hypothetical protein HC902_02425 [Calothrix sp. SM1_5_4]|nr:hypothetical protein [Calothrix sp. SM1_5_4]
MLEASIAIILTLVFIGFFAYIFLMIFYPEWVGITGKAAHKTLDEHKEGSSVDDRDFLNSLGRPYLSGDIDELSSSISPEKVRPT